MATSTNARRFFSMASAASLAGFVLTAAPSAMAACPEPDPGVLPYKSAHAPKTVCTNADHQTLNTTIQDPNATWADLENAVKAQNAACASCIFSKEDDASWAPIVYVGDQGGAFINWGSCFEKAPGGNAACGQALEGFDLCTSVRCTDGAGYCTSQQALEACQDNVANDPNSCGGYDYGTACGASLGDLIDNQCADFFQVVHVLCGGTLVTQPPPDAGTGDPDSGTGTSTDAGTKPPPKPKADAGTKKDASSEDGDGEEPTTGTKDAGKTTTKKDAGGNNADDTGAGGDSDSGCAQSGSSPSGSLATALVAMIAIGGALRNRRRSR